MFQRRLLPRCLLHAALMLSACGTIDEPEGTAATLSGSSSGATGSTSATSDTASTGDGVMSQCSPWLQDCPNGEKCVAYASAGSSTWDANKCVPVLGNGQIGDACKYDGPSSSTDDCGADGWCWNVDADGIGVCTGFCTGPMEDPICESGFGCWIDNQGSINMCMMQCDPLIQNCVSTADWCFYNYMSGRFVCKAATEDLPTGAPCTTIDGCVGGNTCLQAEVFPSCDGFACCAAFCDLTAPNCTQPGTKCVSLFGESAAPEFVNLGVCIVGW